MSAGAILRAVPLALIALMALAVIGFSLRDATGAAAGALGLAAAEEAAAMPIGHARDAKLDEAQGRLSEALQARPDDARLWNALAATRYLQATGAEVRTISQPLVAAAVHAAQRAAELAPEDPVAQARIAQAMSLQARAPRGAALAALMRSYQLKAMDETLAPIRADAAGRLWRELDAATRAAAEAEACLARRGGAVLADVFSAAAANAACAPPPEDRDSSQPGL